MVENQAFNQIGDELAQNLIEKLKQPINNTYELNINNNNNSNNNENNEQCSPNPLIYDPDHFPYDITRAQNHAKKEENFSQETENEEVCPCCQLPIKNEPLPLCCNRNDFDDLGPGLPLYFETIIYCITMLIIVLLIQGLYSLYSNYKTNDCVPENADDEVVCHRDFINKISISNKYRHHDLYIVQSWVNLASMIVVIISLHYYRIFQRRSAEEIDRDNISPSDYTIMITGFPKNSCDEELVEKTVMSFWNRIPHEENEANNIITKIVLAYDIVDYVTLCRERKKLFLEERRSQHMHKEHGKAFDEHKLREKIQFVENAIKKQEDEVKQKINNKTCGIAFVSFRTQKFREEFMERTELTFLQKARDFLVQKIFCCCKYSLHRFHVFNAPQISLKVQRAAEPDEIIWENLGYTARYRFFAKCKTFFLTLIVLCFCFVLIFGVSYLQEDLKEKFSGEKKMEKALKVLSIVASFLIVFINTCLVLQIRKFADMEKNLTTTEYYISVASKLTYAQFANTALIVLLANLSILRYWKLFSQGGLPSDLFMIFLSNAYIPPLMALFDPFFFLKLLQKWFMERKRKKGHSITTQNEAHEMYEGPTIDMSSKYAALTKTMWLTSFYVCITPIGLIISIFNLIIVYWVDKYLLLRRYARPKVVSQKLSQEMLELIEYCPFFMAAGSLIFHHILFDPKLKHQLPDIIAIAIGCFNFIFPTANIMSFFKKNETGVIGEDKQYEHAENEDFCGSNYDLSNPVTRETALETLNHTRLQKTMVGRVDESVARHASNENYERKISNSQERNRISYLENYANMGERPNFVYKKTLSQKLNSKKTLQIELERNIIQSGFQQNNLPLLQSQIINDGFAANPYQGNNNLRYTEINNQQPSYNYPQFPEQGMNFNIQPGMNPPYWNNDNNNHNAYYNYSQAPNPQNNYNFGNR